MGLGNITLNSSARQLSQPRMLQMRTACLTECNSAFHNLFILIQWGHQCECFLQHGDDWKPLPSLLWLAFTICGFKQIPLFLVYLSSFISNITAEIF